MTRIPIDRGAPGQGLQKTLRDHRVPFNMMRALKNFRMPDKRLRRRRGFTEYMTVPTRVHGNQLAKHSGATLQQVPYLPDTKTIEERRGLWKTPMSYGVIKWHDDFQPKIGRNFTVEFLLTLGEVEPLVSHDPLPSSAFGTSSGFVRISPSYNGSTLNFLPRSISGVFVYDQMIIANDCKIDNGSKVVSLPTNPDDTNLSNPSHFDCVALPSLAIAYNKALDGGDKDKVRFEVEWTLFDAGNNKYFRQGSAQSLIYAHVSYVAGTTYHIAVTYTASDDKVRLYIDGVLKKTSADITIGLGSNAKWAGEEDFINGVDRQIKRDIVILNEATVRGNYASTCAFMHRTAKVSTNTGDWTEDASTGKWELQLRSDASKKSIQAVWTHDRTALLGGHTRTCNGIVTGYQDEKSSKANLSTNGDWFYDSATGKLWIYSTTGTNPVTRFGEIELIFDFIGSPNLLPHMREGSLFVNPTSIQVSQPNPWCCAPSRGTAMSELRIWHEARSATNLLAKKLIRISTGGNLKGYWYLNDGSGVCIDQVAGQLLTLHHGPPVWVKDTGLLGQLGISIRDGQHLIKSFDSADSVLYVDDAYVYLETCMNAGQTIPTYAEDSEIDAKGDFTVMMQIRTPKAYQQDISKIADVLRRKSGVLWDGGQTRVFVREYADEHHPDGVICHAQSEGHRQTLWSIEGTKNRKANDPIADVNRIPVAQAFIDKVGAVRFESLQRWYDSPNGFPVLNQIAAGKSLRVDGVSYTAGTGNNTKRFTASSAPFTSGDEGLTAVIQTDEDEVIMVSTVTFVSSTTVDLDYYWSAANTHKITIFNSLDADTVYTITCRQRTEDRGGININSNDVTYLDISIDGKKLIQAKIKRPQRAYHAPNYDVIIGASMVNDGMDLSVTNNDLLAGVEHGPTGRPPWGKEPPLLEHSSQHFMTHHQDQPGDFILGFFRMWAGVGIPDEIIAATFDSALESQFHDTSLIFNLELDQVTGLKVPSRSRYPLVFDMGYKSFGGGIHSWAAAGFGTALLAEPDPHIPAGWSMEDRLGFIPQPTQFDNQYEEAEGRMIAPFNSTLRQQGGILAIFDDSLLFDKDLDGTFSNVYLSAQGLLSDFSPSAPWEGVVIGDRTIMVGQGGVPKVYNGRVCTKAGAARWNGGRYITELLVGGKLTPNRWYQVRLVFHNSNDQLQAVSPPIVFKTGDSSSTGKRKIRIKNIGQHPDPRMTSIRIYATPGHLTEELARGDTPRLTKIGVQLNASYVSGDTGIIFGKQADKTLFPVALALDVVPVPQMATATSHNGRLVGAGNPLVPDAYFWSEAGNPEVFLESSVGILEEGTGDRIIKVISAFGAVFMFKTNSVWRLDETQPGAINPWIHTKLVESVGAVSSKSVCIHIDPDTGRSFIFFWSKHGPYIFDGASFIYVGQPLEQNLDDIAWDWTDIETVAVIHEISEREIISFIQLKNKDRNDVAYSFHYRNSNFETRNFVWSEYTGVIGQVGYTILAVDDVTISGTNLPGSILSMAVTMGAEDKFFPLVAGKNGMIYKWGDSDYDGHPVDANDYASKFLVSTYSGGFLTVTASPNWQDIRGLWATIIKADYSDFFIIPILHNAINAFTVDTNYAAIKFTPVANDIVYIGRPPVEVEFPWDMLDLPFKNKLLHRFLFWAEKDFYYRWKRDWATAWEVAYALISDKVNKRQHIDFGPSPSLEAFKLTLASFEIDSRIDSYAYIVTPQDKEDLDQ